MSDIQPPQTDSPIEDWVWFYYRDLRFNIIPVKTKTKEAAVKWTEFQKRRATEEEIKEWLRAGLFENLAVICGITSGNLTVIDFDEMEAYKENFDSTIEYETLVVRSGSGRGVHVYLRGDKSIAAARYEHDKPKLGIQGQGTIAILPPSTHPDTGRRYEIVSKVVEPKQIAQIEEGLTKLLARLGVKDKKPLSMGEVVKGVKEGGREVNMFRLAWYLLKIVKMSEKDVWLELEERNKANEPPIPESELRHAFESAKKAKKPEQLDEIEKTEFGEEIEPAPDDYGLAEKILHSPNALRAIKILLDETVRREGRNKLYCFLLALSAKHPDPRLKQILVLGGSAGGGKTTLAKILAKLVKTKTVGRFTEHAMDYSNLEKYQMLYVQELLDLEQQKRMGISTIRFLSSDDEGYTVEFVTGDPQTGFSTQQRKIPAMTVLTTTTVPDTEAQFERRIHRVNMDESAETTRAVLDWKAQEEKRAVFEWIGDLEPRRGIYVLKAVVDLLRPCKISTAPISHSLTAIFKMSHLRARGDYNKLLALTEMIAWLHQEQRPYAVRGVEGHEEKLLFALPQDAYYALQIGLHPIITMTTGLDKRLRDLLPSILELKDAQYSYKHGGVEDAVKGFSISQLLSVARATAKPDLSRSRLYQWLKVLEDRGLLASTKPSRENVYNLVSESEVENLTKIVSNPELETQIAAELAKEAETFFSAISQEAPLPAIGVSVEDWFDQDELDRDLTPLIEGPPTAEFKMPLKVKIRKDGHPLSDAKESLEAGKEEDKQDA